MKLSWHAIALSLGLVWLLGASGSIAQGEGPGAQGAAEAALDDAGLREALSAVRDELGAPALAAAAIRADGPRAVVVARAAVGTRAVNADAPVAIDDRFHLGSLSKSMTATMLARLVERGVLSWDTTIERAMPDVARQVPESHRGVTLAQLLTHRSGLPDDRQGGELLVKAWGLEGTLAQRRRAYVGLAFEQPGVRPPGEGMAYSNSGYVIAGVMAETTTGTAWEDLMRIEVFEPLGLTTAGFGPPRGEGGRIEEPLGHVEAVGRLTPTPPIGGVVADNPDIWGPAGTIHMSIGDLATYVADHLAGERGGGALLKPETYLHLHTPPEGSGYAFGWVVRREGGARTRLGHAGSNGRWYSVMSIDLERGVAGVAATNAASDAARRACQDAIRRVGGE